MNVLTLEPNERSVRQLIQLGEGPQVEFKGVIPSVTMLAQLISAFANTEGGVILIGVAESPVLIRSIIWQDMVRVFDRATENLKNFDGVVLHQVPVDGHIIGYIRVKKSPTVVVGPAGAYQRVDDQARPLTSDEIAARSHNRAPGDWESLIRAIAVVTNTVNSQTETLNNQTTTIETLQNQVAYAQSVRGQWVNLLISFIMGCITGVIGNLITMAVIN